MKHILSAIFIYEFPPIVHRVSLS